MDPTNFGWDLFFRFFFCPKIIVFTFLKTTANLGKIYRQYIAAYYSRANRILE